MPVDPIRQESGFVIMPCFQAPLRGRISIKKYRDFKTQILPSRRRHAALCALENILFAGKQPGYP
jgi:hypothetical protein